MVENNKVENNEFDLVSFIIDYEDGRLSLEDTLRLFSYLIGTGQVWALQGSYGRAAAMFIDAGIISRDGTILKTADELEDEYA